MVLVLQACLPPGLGAQNQQWTLTVAGRLLSPKGGGCLALLGGAQPGEDNAVRTARASEARTST